MEDYTTLSSTDFIEMLKAGKKIEKQIVADEVIIKDETINREINVENCVLQKLSLENCVLNKPVLFKNVMFKDSVSLNLDPEKEHKNPGQTVFVDTVQFIKCSFQNILHGKNLICEKECSFEESTFQQRVVFAKASFLANASFSNVNFEGTCRFEGTSFRDTASFESATFIEKANFKKVFFHNTFLFRKAHFKNDVTFENGNFIGFARFEDMTCDGKCVLKKVTMHKKSYFHRVHFGSDAVFRGVESMGDLHLSWLTCKGILDLTGIEAHNSIYVQESTCENEVLFQRSVFHHDLHLMNSVFHRRVSLKKTVFHMRLNCSGASFEQDIELHSSSPNILILTREQIEGKIAAEIEKKYAKAKEVYVMLRRSFDYWGEHENSEWAYYNFRLMERKAKDKSKLSAKALAFLDWLFFDLGCGYGTKPANVTILATFSVLLFSILFWFNGEHFVINPDLRVTSEGVSFYQALYISAMNFVTMGTEGISASFDHWIKYFVAVEGFLGLFLMTVFVGTYTRKMAK